VSDFVGRGDIWENMSASDADLLRQYAGTGSEPAFAALVQRHLDLVYSAAWRQVRCAHLAKEVAQSVFIDLARNAASIRPGTPLVAWLHVVSRRTAIDIIRRESRRQSREQQAAAMVHAELIESAAMKSTSPEWNGIEPLLDEAVESLNEADRAAILLRYFENKSLREVGAALGTSEDTAQKRVSRAVEQLRSFLFRRGITVSAAGLVSDLSAHALHHAPAGLGATITAAAGALPPIALTATATAAVLTMTTLEKTIVTAAFVLALGSVMVETNALRAQRVERTALQQHNDQLAREARQLRQERDGARRRGDETQRRVATAVPATAGAASDPAMEAVMRAWLDRVERLKQLQGERPELSIPELALLPEDRWMAAARDARLETDAEIRAAFASLRQSAESTFIGRFQRALRAYLDANDGQLPTQASQVAPLFEPPVDPAALASYTMLASGKLADLPPEQRNYLVEKRAPVDLQRDMHWRFSLNSVNTMPALGDHVNAAIREFGKANNGARPTEASQLQRFLPAPVDAARLQPYLNPPTR
jgi:RNA polymerase sigma factor (sigma-70 family)